MKKIIYYITIPLFTLLFLGCTPTFNYPFHSTEVIDTPPKKVTKHSKKSLGKKVKRAKKSVKHKKKKVKTDVVLHEPSKTKEPEELKEIQATSSVGTNKKEASKKDNYGKAPRDYRKRIKRYLSTKSDSSYSIKYVFSRPYKAKKRNSSWRGWAVDVDRLKRNGKGKILKNKPYTILFNGSSIKEKLNEEEAKTVSKVIY